MQPTVAPTMSPEIAVNPILMFAIGLLGLAALVCWILEVVAAFKKEEKPLMGILSIVLCSLGGFVIGWIHSKKWGIQKVMIAWTILVIVVTILYAVAIASVSASVVEQIESEGAGAPSEISIEMPTVPEP